MKARRAQWIAAIVVILALIGGGLAAHQLLQGGATVITPPTAKEKAVFTLINRERTERGLPALKYDPVMARLARQHNADMLRRNYFSHDEPGGRTYAERVHSVLVSPGRHALGENIVYGSGPFGTASGLVRSWMASPPHKANILDPRFHRTGLGVASAPGEYQGAYGISVATQDFSD